VSGSIMQYKEIKVRIIFLTLFIFLTGCSSIPIDDSTKNIEKNIEVVTIEKDVIPQIWSDHKVLDISEDVCAQKAVDILTSLGFKSIVKNNTYVYGNYINNRAAIKCARVNNKTFVYAVVAGPKVKVVERLRNEIVWKL
jgi:uncharacterized protein YceK